MPVGWFVARYKRRPTTPEDPTLARYCAVDDYTRIVRGDGGSWAEAECLGDRAVVKVRASSATLALISADPAIGRFPVHRLHDPLSSAPAAQLAAINIELVAMGYPRAEIDAAFPDGLQGATLRDLIRFILRRRQLPTGHHPVTGEIVFGPVHVACRPLEHVDAAVD